MTKSELETVEQFTIEEFQDNFDELMDLVESGKSFLVKSENGNVIVMPYQEYSSIYEKIGYDDEFVRIHRDHEEGS